MPTSYTNLLGLALPVQGELSGTWGNEVNNYITQYLDASVAGTQTISGSLTAVTLSKTTNATLSQAGTGATGSSQYQIINCTGNPATQLTVTVPAASKAYLVLNNTSTNQSVKIVGAGPTTGVTVAAARCALIAWNGTDFELVASTDASTLSGVLAAVNGGTGQSSYAVGDLLYASTTTALSKLAGVATGNALISGGVNTAPSYGKIGLTTHVSGTLPIANGGTNATTEAAARTNLGATTLGANIFTITNPSAITFPRFNADNTVSALSAADFRTAIGAGTGGGTVSSVDTGSGLTGGPITSTGTIAVATNGISNTLFRQSAAYSVVGRSASTTGDVADISAASDHQVLRRSGTSIGFGAIALNQSGAVTGTLAVANGGTGASTLTANNVLLGNGTSALQVVAPGTSGNVLTSNGTTWVSQALAATGSEIIRVARTSNTALTSANKGNLIDITSGTFTQTFNACSTLGNGWFVYIQNSGTGDITLDPNASETIDGLTSYIMYPGEVRLVQCDGTALRTIVLNAFYRTFTASGTFTKPPGYLAFQGLLWGGGGSGGRTGTTAYYSGGGGGGACAPFDVSSGSVTTSVTVTIGAGGLAQTGAANGNTGGTSSFGTLVYAYGGGGGGGNATADLGGGGGGGVLSAGAVGGNGLGGAPSPNITISGTDRGADNPGFGGGNAGTVGGNSAYGGGAGGRDGASGGVVRPAGSSWYGGGGGGGGPTAPSDPGTSVFGGAGGAGGAFGVNGTAGTAPGGGGGATRTGTASGAGARGELRIWGII